MTQPMKILTALLASLAATCLFAGAAAAGSSPSNAFPGIQHPPAGHFKPSSLTISQCKSGSFGCYEQALGNVAYKSGPNAAIAEVQTMLDQKNPTVLADCHTILHLIGSATLAALHGDVAKAMGEGSMLCGSGYYHGLIEFALEGAKTMKQLDQKVIQMCSDTKILNTSFLRYQCLHGLGHGVMIYSADDLPFALSLCSKLSGTWDQQSCSGGVFMQNFNLPSKLSPFESTFVKRSDLLYPCDDPKLVSTEYKLYCYLQVTEHILQATNYNWKTAVATCEKAPMPWMSVCFQSYGRDASGASDYTPPVAYKTCQLTGSHLPDCVYGVARDFTNNDIGGDRAAKFCNLVGPRNVRGFCFYSIGTILDGFGHGQQWLASTCSSLSKTYASACEGHLNRAEWDMITPLPAA
jgi:hypothetical protein